MTPAEAESVKRYSSRLIEDYDGDRFDEDENGYDATARAAFVAGTEWQASRPFTDEQVGALAEFFGCDLEDSREALDAMRNDLNEARAALETEKVAQAPATQDSTTVPAEFKLEKTAVQDGRSNGFGEVVPLGAWDFVEDIVPTHQRRKLTFIGPWEEIPGKDDDR